MKHYLFIYDGEYGESTFECYADSKSEAIAESKKFSEDVMDCLIELQVDGE